MIFDPGWRGRGAESTGARASSATRVIDRETATSLRAAVGLRNGIAHGYALLDYARVHQEAQTGIPALRRFLLGSDRYVRRATPVR
jgi:hypothetical protein